MENRKIKPKNGFLSGEAAPLTDEITEWDQNAFFKITSTTLTDEQATRIRQPQKVYPMQDAVLGVHWHPEHIPMDLIMDRVDAMFPASECELLIPTQHNELLALGDYAGVEVDCFSKGFNRKVQLLIHMSREKAERASVLKSMLAHTFKYRASQLLDFIDAVVNPSRESLLMKAASETVANEDLVSFVRISTKKFLKLLEENEAAAPPESFKNKLLFMYFDELGTIYGSRLVGKAKLLLTAVKQAVKAEFSLQYFYSTEEVIEEARALGAGIVVPHPEQFWPILLADYDLDGYEVWNPQSRQYTEFLIQVVLKQNMSQERRDRPLLIFMGDDTHMSEKARPLELQNPEKAAREVGLQPGWDDVSIRKSLITAEINRKRIINEYIARIS